MPKPSPRDQFIAAALECERGSNTGDHRRVNRNMARIDKITRVIRQLDDRGRSLFLDLLGHESLQIQLFAAWKLLPTDEAVALSTLDRIAKGNDWIALDAMMTAERWEAGELRVE